MDNFWSNTHSSTSNYDSWNSSSSFSENNTNYQNHDAFSSNPVSNSNWSLNFSSSSISRPSLNIPSHIKIKKFPFDSSLQEIRTIFGRYGKVSRVVCDYRISEEKLNVWLDYEDERVIGNVIERENNRKLHHVNLIVEKGNDSNESSSFNEGRKFGSKKDSWPNNSWSSAKNDSGFNNNATIDWDKLDSNNSYSLEKKSRNEKRSNANDRGGNRRGSKNRDHFSPYDKLNGKNSSGTINKAKSYDDWEKVNCNSKSLNIDDSNELDSNWD